MYIKYQCVYICLNIYNVRIYVDMFMHVFVSVYDWSSLWKSQKVFVRNSPRTLIVALCIQMYGECIYVHTYIYVCT